jgi:predicted nucleic acid-binding protein
VAAPVDAPDSSVLIAGFVPEHPFHEQATEALPSVRSKGRLIAHTMAETYAVLTGQPYAHPAANVLRYLDQFLSRSPLGLGPTSYAESLRRLAQGDVKGSAIYDGLIAAAARDSEHRLISLDRRAARVYRLFDVDFELLA